jgi:polyisoprenoid-binding protein YceI
MIARLSCLLAVLSTEAALAAPRTFTIDEGTSSASAHVGKTGFASFAGHEHVVVARNMQGEVVLDAENLAASSVDIIVDARSLKVREEGEPEGDAVKVQQAMRGPHQLDVDAHRTIHFRSTEVKGRQAGPAGFELQVVGELSLHGMKKPYSVPIKLAVNGNQLVASGKLVIKQSDFGIEPTTAAGGLVKVENEVPVEFKIAARATGP